MDALTTYYIRRAALEMMAHQPELTVYVPDEPSQREVVAGQTANLLNQCKVHAFADQIAFDHELLINDIADILWEVGKAYTSFQRHEVVSIAAMALLGERITEIVELRLEQVARWQYEHGVMT